MTVTPCHENSDPVPRTAAPPSVRSRPGCDIVSRKPSPICSTRPACWPPQVVTPCHWNTPRSSRLPSSASRGGSRGCDTMSRVPKSTASTGVAFAGRTTALAVTPCHEEVPVLAPPSRPSPGDPIVLAVTPCHEHRFPTPRPDASPSGGWLLWL